MTAALSLRPGFLRDHDSSLNRRSNSAENRSSIIVRSALSNARLPRACCLASTLHRYIAARHLRAMRVLIALRASILSLSKISAPSRGDDVTCGTSAGRAVSKRIPNHA